MAVAGNQQPITVTYTEIVTGLVKQVVVQPLVGLDGGDGTRVDPTTKANDDVWHPYRALNDTTEFVAAPATRVNTTANDTNVIAAGLASI